jgi:hypothetical protein
MPNPPAQEKPATDEVLTTRSESGREGRWTIIEQPAHSVIRCVMRRAGICDQVKIQRATT